jgi:hypothetical protein
MATASFTRMLSFYQIAVMFKIILCNAKKCHSKAGQAIIDHRINSSASTYVPTQFTHLLKLSLTA